MSNNFCIENLQLIKAKFTDRGILNEKLISLSIEEIDFSKETKEIINYVVENWNSI